MTPLHSFIALGPLAVYLLLLGLINFTRRPFLTSGARDLFALGLSLTGMMVVGPLDLFLPISAATRFGPYVWLLVLALFWLTLSLITLSMRPRLVIYNITLVQLRPVIAQMIQRLGLEHQWAGESLSLPSLGVQLRLEAFPLLRNVALASNGVKQSFHGWHQLERELARELSEVQVAPQAAGAVMIAIGILMFAGLQFRLSHETATSLANSLYDLLRM